MGIRIHKAVGFGTLGFTPPVEWGDTQDRAHSTTLGEFTLWARAHQTEILSHWSGPKYVRDPSLELLDLNYADPICPLETLEPLHCLRRGI